MPDTQNESPSNQENPKQAADSYWTENLKLLLLLLSIWFLVSFGCGVLFVDVLNAVPFFGFKLGFWFAQQGAIYGFIAIIVIYAIQMGRIERRYGIDD